MDILARAQVALRRVHSQLAKVLFLLHREAEGVLPHLLLPQEPVGDGHEALHRRLAQRELKSRRKARNE